MSTVKLAQKIRKFKIVLEIREIYADVYCTKSNLSNTYDKLRNKEKNFFKIADKYIFPTEQLNKIINIQNKPKVIATGVYRVADRICEKTTDSIIHLVYAGTLSKEKGGAYAATSAASFLPANYHIHILGYGTYDEIKEINHLISDTAKDMAKVTFDGLLRGEEFTRFLQKCHIGLATQDINGGFNCTSFPSKILTYMSNGLEVVSGRIPVVEESAIGKYVHFYEEQTPQAIANTILKIVLGEYTSPKSVLTSLDKKLRSEIVAVLK